MPASYVATNRTTTVHRPWMASMGAAAAGPRAVIDLAAQRRGILHVPMDFVLNGPWAAVMTTAVYTDALSACEAVAIIGCDAAGTPQRFGFAHVLAGDPGNVDWTRLFAGMAGHTLYAVIDTSRRALTEHGADLLASVQTRVPDANILLYVSGTGEDGRSFGIDALGNFGELADTLVDREKGAKADRKLVSDNYMHPPLGAGPRRFNKKVPKG